MLKVCQIPHSFDASVRLRPLSPRPLLDLATLTICV